MMHFLTPRQQSRVREFLFIFPSGLPKLQSLWVTGQYPAQLGPSVPAQNLVLPFTEGFNIKGNTEGRNKLLLPASSEHLEIATTFFESSDTKSQSPHHTDLQSYP